MDTDQYLGIFIEEGQEHLQSVNTGLLDLEQDHNTKHVDQIFRSAHTIKGMAATMGFEDLTKLTHHMENVLDAIRHQKISVTTDIIDVLFQAVNILEVILTSIAEGGDGKRDVGIMVSLLAQAEQGETRLVETASNQEGHVQKSDQSATYTQEYDQYEQTILRESIDKGLNVYQVHVILADDCLLKAARVFMVFGVFENVGDVLKSDPSVSELEEERFEYSFTVTLASKEISEHIQTEVLNISEVKDVRMQSISMAEFEKVPQESRSNQPSEMNKDPESQVQSTKATYAQSIRVNVERIDRLMNLFEEMIIDRGRLEQMAKEVDHPGIVETVEKMAQISGSLQDTILGMRMVPIEQVFNRFPTMVRNLSKELNKKVHLIIHGADTELDRRVIDQIGDPLVHLIRNSIDHGLESPEERLKKGKNESGDLTLNAFHSGNDVIIDIKDDGAGIQREKVLQKAIQGGVISSEHAKTLSDSEVYALLFSSGFSTADHVSDISGRGVGLDVVKSTIESLGGTITVESVLDQGSTFSIQLPLTLSIISALLVDIQSETYAIPLSSILETASINKVQIMNAHSHKVMNFRDKIIPVIFLEDIFDLETNRDKEYYSVVIVRKGDKMVGLVVDSFVGQREIVMKSLGKFLSQTFAISGATILGDGHVALIIDCNQLVV